MSVSNDCTNTQSELGRNLTPVQIGRSIHEVFGGLELDVASDHIANESIQAERFFTFADDGFQQDWDAETAFVQPPGNTLTGGTLKERLYWKNELKKPKEKRGKKPKHVGQISASEWHKRAFEEYQQGNLKHVIGLCYRAGSIGSLGIELLSEATICLTCSGVESQIINGSGRMAFEIVEKCQRISQTSNTQSSLFYILSMKPIYHIRFRDEFSQYGVVK